MRKILLTTTALIAMAATQVMADELKVTPTGSLDFQAGGRSVKSQYLGVNKNVSNLKKFAFYTEAQVGIKVDAKADNGLNYGGRIGLMAQTAKDNRTSKTRLDQSYIYLGSDMLGRVELGENFGAIDTMKVDATSVAVGNGGPLGTWNSFTGVGIGPVVGIAGTQSFDFIPNVIAVNSNSVLNSVYHPRKATYYSPVWEGVQFGLSYTPDSTNISLPASAGGSGGITNNISGKALKDDVAVALSYNNQFDNVTVAGSLTGEFAKAQDVNNGTPLQTTKLKSMRSYAAGASISYANVTLAGSYGNLGHSMNRISSTGTPAVEAANKKSYWTVGTAYNQGPVGASLTYVQAKNGAAKLQLLSLGAEYKLAEGLMPYAEVNMFQNKDAAFSTSTTKWNGKQKGTVYLVGTKLQF